MILIGTQRAVPPRPYDAPPAVRGVEKRILIGPNQGATRFVMRHFAIAPQGHSPEHAHPWEHEVYVLSGRGRVLFADGAADVDAGDFVFVPPMDVHQFRNAGDVPLEFLCVVPLAGEDG